MPQVYCPVSARPHFEKSSCPSLVNGGRCEPKNLRLRFVTKASETVNEIENDRSQLDVSSNCVTPVFRSTPTLEENTTTQVKVLFLSEGNVCRSVYAEAFFNALVNEKGLQDDISCASKASRDYNLGEGPDDRALKVAKEFNLVVPEDSQATLFQSSVDIVAFDIALVMDKFIAADVLKEVSVFDTINPEAKFSSKVRRLGDFCQSRKVEDIDDPLYGNMGGPDEVENLKAVFADVKESCEGLFNKLLEIKASLKDGQTWKSAIKEWLLGLEDMEWMVPPMLQKKKTT